MVMPQMETSIRSELDIEGFEARAAETIGEMKALFAEFKDRLGEVVSAQRLANSEARNEAAKSRAAFEELVQQAKAIVGRQDQALKALREGWRMHVAENSRVAGEEIARAFGTQIASALTHQLDGMSTRVERVTLRFGWMSWLKWTAGIAFGIVLTIGLGVAALLPRAAGLPWHDIQAAAARLQVCEIDHETHVCIATDNKARVMKYANGEPVVVVRGPREFPKFNGRRDPTCQESVGQRSNRGAGIGSRARCSTRGETENGAHPTSFQNTAVSTPSSANAPSTTLTTGSSVTRSRNNGNRTHCHTNQRMNLPGSVMIPSKRRCLKFGSPS
jgi:hypothetical protein